MTVAEPPPRSRSRPDRACRSKLRYATEASAVEAAARQANDFGVSMDTYGCPHCGAWHTGNVPRWLALDREYGVFRDVR